MAIDLVNDKLISLTGLQEFGTKYTAKYVGDIKDAEGNLQTVKAYVDQEVASTSAQTAQVASDLADEITRAKAAEKANADAIEAHKTAIDAKVTTLVGDDTDKSVRTISAEEVAKVVANAPQSFDTLKEIADWIENDTTGAAKMANDISALKTQVGVEAVGETPATGLVKDIRDLQAAIGEGGNVAAQITAAIEALDADASQVAGADGLALSVTEVDGKITAISGSIAANTYDAHGSAKAVQGETTETVASVLAKLQGINVATTAEIDAIFA